jgi:mannose-1-phosphate guanylyltransferase
LLTDLDLGEFINFHNSNDGLLSIAVTQKKVGVDLGVLEARNGVMTNFKEKPTLEYMVSMGIYCMEPGILELIPQGVPFGFDNLIYAMMQADLPVYVYEHKGIWMDIGREEDFRIAQKDFMKEHKSIILGC